VGVVDSTSSSCSSGLLFTTVGPQPGEYQGVRLATRWLSASVAVISAHGEIDAFNASNLTDYALGALRRCRALILELSGLNFCAAGFATLHTIDRRCAQMGYLLGRGTQRPGVPVTAALRSAPRAAHRSQR
jgi:hypothetical protein